MRHQDTARRQGDFALIALKLTLLGCVASLVGVLGLVVWRVITQA